MSLLQQQEASPPPPPGARWLPSHVQVTVGQARGLRPKGGPGDAFVVLRLGRQKHRTAVATTQQQRSSGGGGGGAAAGLLCPRWDDEGPCALELPPSSEPDAEALLLQVTVWQRALVGLDRFLGRAAVPLGPLLDGAQHHHQQDLWYKLHSKPGKKEKERGEIQIGIQFTSQSLTASMFDLSIKDKPRSPFGKLKDKVKGRKKYDLESASAIVPCSSGVLEEACEQGSRKATAKGGFFFKHKLRRASLTQSNTSLGSDSTVSSASSMVAFGLPEGVLPSPGSRHGSLSSDRPVRDFMSSPKLTHKRAFSDEVSQISMLLPDSRSVQSLKPQSEPVSRSSVCINGSHIYCDEPSPKPSALLPATLPPPPHDVPKKPEESFGIGPGAPGTHPSSWAGSGFQKDPPRFIPSPPILAAQEEDKLSVKTIALNKHRSRVKMGEGLHEAESKPVPIAAPVGFSSDVKRVRPHEDIPKEQEAAAARVKPAAICCGNSTDDSGKSRMVEDGGSLQRVAVAGRGEGGRVSSWFGLKASKEPSQRRSSLSEPLVSSEDPEHWPFVRVGSLPPEAAPHSLSSRDADGAAAAATRAAWEWEDNSFEAFATSRLRPEVRGEPLAALEGCEGTGDLLHSVPEERLLPGGPSLAEQLPRQDGAAAFSWAAAFAKGTCQEANPATRAEQSGKSRPAPSPEAASLDSEPPLGCAHRENLLLHPVSEEKEEERPQSPAPKESRLESPAQAPSEADRWHWDYLPSASPPVPICAGQAHLPVEASQSALLLGQEEEGGAVAWQIQERRAELPPPKPPRRFTPLHREEEANEALGGLQRRWQDGVALYEKQEEGLAEAADQQGAPQGYRCPSPVAAASPAPVVIIGTGAAGHIPYATEGLGPVPGDGGEAGTNELISLEVSSGNTLLGLSEGTAGAEQFGTCPLQPSLGGLGLAGAKDEAGRPLGKGGVPCSSCVTETARQQQQPPPELSLSHTVLRPSPGPQEAESSHSALFWTAVEEEEQQQQRQPGDCVGLEQPKGPGLAGARAGAADGVEPPGGHTSQAPLTTSVHPQAFASGMPRHGPRASSASDSELSSSWSEDQVIDFKKADFWQPSQVDPARTPGNPFAPSMQKNPFVGSQPDVLLPAPSFRSLPAEEASLTGLPPALPACQPLAFSTPALEAARDLLQGFRFPSPIGQPASNGGSTAAAAALLQANVDAVAPSVVPMETQLGAEMPVPWAASPHPVKPIRSSVPERAQEEKPRRSSLTLIPCSSQEKLKPSGVHLAAPIWQLDKSEPPKDPSALNPSVKYCHLTHEELIQLLLKREAELSRKQEHIRELENYIDRLLVRIMEQAPTLLQIPLGREAKVAK